MSDENEETEPTEIEPGKGLETDDEMDAAEVERHEAATPADPFAVELATDLAQYPQSPEGEDLARVRRVPRTTQDGLPGEFPVMPPKGFERPGAPPEEAFVRRIVVPAGSLVPVLPRHAARAKVKVINLDDTNGADVHFGTDGEFGSNPGGWFLGPGLDVEVETQAPVFAGGVGGAVTICVLSTWHEWYEGGSGR